MTLKNLFVSYSVAEDSNESIDDSNEDIAGLQDDNNVSCYVA